MYIYYSILRYSIVYYIIGRLLPQSQRAEAQGGLAPARESSRRLLRSRRVLGLACAFLHSAKGGVVETGCSDFYGVIYHFVI